MAIHDGRDLSGDKVGFYIWHGSTLDKATVDKVIAGTIAAADFNVSGKAFVDGDTGEFPDGIDGESILIDNVDSVSAYGTTTNSTTLQPYRQKAFNIRTASTITDITISAWPNFSNAEQAKLWSDVATGAIKAGSQVMFIERIQGNTPANKGYNVAVGILGAINHDPQKESAQSYSRTLTVNAVVFGIAG